MSVPTEIINLKPPPATDDFDSEIEEYLLNPERLSIHKWEPGVLPRQVKIDTLYEVHELPEYIEVENVRDRKTGEILGYKEKIIDITMEILGDLSMKRPPLPPEQQTRGTTTSLPFWPAGFEDEMLKASSITIILNQMPLNIDGEDEPGKFLGEDLLTVPPDFEYGLEFADDGYTLLSKHKGSTPADTTELEPSKPDEQELDSDEIKFEIEEILVKDDHLKGLWTDTDEKMPEKTKKERRQVKLEADADDSFLDSCLIQEPTPLPEIPVLEITASSVGSTVATVTEWAEMLDVTQPVGDFNERIPNMAQKYPFELDTFQKQLEEGHHVFVAAHTSAGKTVVAEYAIALSQRHCTRTIYTSPIKALSNQKYNDFVKTFGDVGLLTGDLQLNPAAACLVMTTEILRSMLYSGSDVTRDLEFVIFDEVHYINNAERGHVWEEVLILLPAHVGIVLLSATVPNTLEFADWVGRTKKRKVYVVSTPKRPVPLCHYLYTGSGGKSKHERFLVVDQDGNFQLKGYNEAVTAKNSRQTDYKKNYGPKGKAMLNPKQEQTLWMAFIDHLKTNDKLPVVVFALSRVRCDMYAENLMCVDLTTAKEKSHIHAFFQRCLQRLKPPDRKLPQVVRLQRVLMNGIGVHHSGILPLLKEIVEMLFQTGFVKILFATETFAMGVNMPARTVVFDEITKFDGVERRNLVPAEYIQMAGRAGRRGLDATGTVIILCKAGVPQLTDLKAMILGIPQRLSSQFRLTYAMILSLMRVASVSVEGMMQRSFREFKQTLKADDYRKQLLQAEKECDEVCQAALPSHLVALAAFYDAALAFVEQSGDMMAILLSQPKVAKEMVQGRVLVVSVGPYLNQLAIYLNNKGPRSTPYKVLVLETSKGNQDHGIPNLEVEESWYRILGMCAQYDKVGAEEPTLEHTILCIAHKNVLQVTKTTLKIDEAILIQDWEKRQIPRFKDAPVGATCLQAVQELSRLSHGVHTGAVGLEYINLTQNLVISSGERLQALDRIKNLKRQVEALRKATDIANLKCELGVVYGRKQAERKRDNLRRLLSYESMALYPDYVRRLEVLRELHYIEDQDRVALKGRVACEMGTNELLISELIFGSVLTELEPAEIAALLSALVFQAKTTVEHPLPPRLQAAVATLQKIDADLRSIEHKYLVSQFEGQGERLNMGLVRVVYEWAQEKPFADIMELTDVQEGIIVRCIQQLNEVLQDVKDAAILIGEPKLQQKMIEASSAIKRDIVFAASLYTTQKEGAD